MKNKILFIVTLGEAGGAQKNVLRSAMSYKKSGCEVTVSSGADGYLRENAGLLDIPFIKFRSLRRTKNPLMNALFLGEIFLYLTKNNFNSIHVYSPNALVAAIPAKLTRKECHIRFTFGGLSILDPMYGLRPLTRRLLIGIYRILLLFVDEYVFENHANRNDALQTKLVPHGVVNIAHVQKMDTSLFASKNECIRYLGELVGKDLSSRFLMGSLGRLTYQKNYQFLLHVFNKKFLEDNNAVCIILGSGPDWGLLKEKTRSLHLDELVYFPGNVENASRYLRGFNLFVLPSRYEGTSNALMEALFAGLPILASKIPSNREMLEDSKEQLFTLGSKEDFILKLSTLIENKPLRDELGKKNLLSTQRFIESNIPVGQSSYYEKYPAYPK